MQWHGKLLQSEKNRTWRIYRMCRQSWRWSSVCSCPFLLWSIRQFLTSSLPATEPCPKVVNSLWCWKRYIWTLLLTYGKSLLAQRLSFICACTSTALPPMLPQDALRDRRLWQLQGWYCLLKYSPPNPGICAFTCSTPREEVENTNAPGWRRWWTRLVVCINRYSAFCGHHRPSCKRLIHCRLGDFVEEQLWLCTSWRWCRIFGFSWSKMVPGPQRSLSCLWVCWQHLSALQFYAASPLHCCSTDDDHTLVFCNWYRKYILFL